MHSSPFHSYLQSEHWLLFHSRAIMASSVQAAHAAGSTVPPSRLLLAIIGKDAEVDYNEARLQVCINDRQRLLRETLLFSTSCSSTLPSILVPVDIKKTQKK
jgi:hypothetical protein